MYCSADTDAVQTLGVGRTFFSDVTTLGPVLQKNAKTSQQALRYRSS